jgi:adenosylcobinamide kinase/adenosylcobinamide-phosphate guanylyltransferase
MGKLIFVLGGARSGKSNQAQNLAAEIGGHVALIATAQALDDEMAARIQNHKALRPKEWTTLELPTRVGHQLMSRSIKADVIIVDCLTLLVSNLLVMNSNSDGSMDEQSAARSVEEEISDLLEAITALKSVWIIVSNEVGMGLVPPNPMGRLYRDLLGRSNQRIASCADQVILMIAGIPMVLGRK